MSDNIYIEKAKACAAKAEASDGYHDRRQAYATLGLLYIELAKLETKGIPPTKKW